MKNPKRKSIKGEVRKVLERDRHCVWCHSTYGLHAHHVYFHATDSIRYSEDRNKAENMVTLCAKCHNMGNVGEGVHTGNKMIDEFCRKYINNLKS